MPQLQVLPGVPGFGQQLGQVLGNALGNIGQGYIQRRSNISDQAILNQIQQNPNLTPMELVGHIGRLSPQKQQTLAPVLAAMIGPQAQSYGETQNLLRFLGGGLAQGASNIQPSQQQAAQLEGQQEMQQQVVQPQPQIGNVGDLTKLSDEQLAVVASMPGIIGKLGQQIDANRKEAFKSTAPYREQILNQYEAAKNTTAQLNKLEALNEKGDLAKPLLAKFADVTGIPLSVLSNPDSEEFEKGSQNLVKGITEFYGNRILLAEVQNFLKTIPTLMNSKEGRARIIDGMRALLEPASLAYDAYKQILKEEGSVPKDLHEKITERISPKLDELAEKFKRVASEFSIVETPDGRQVQVPRNKVDAALKAGGKLI